MKQFKRVLLLTAFISPLLFFLSCGGGSEEEGPMHTVTFNSDGGTPATTQVKVTDGATVSPPAAPSKDRYTFVHWYAGTDKNTPFSFNTPVTSSFTLKVHWLQHKFLVTFDCGGGVPAAPNQILLGTERVQRPATDPELEDYVFLDWYTADDELFVFGQPVTSDITVYAKYERGDFKIVTFVMNGGSPQVQPQKVHGQNLPVKPTSYPSRAKFVFDDWYSDTGCTTKFDFSQPLTRDTTLYAGFRAQIAFSYPLLLARLTGASAPEQEPASLLNPNRTHTDYNVGGTDLGIIWEMTPNKVGIFFGDTYGRDHIQGGNGGPQGGDWRANVLAFSTDTDLSDGLTITSMAMDPVTPKRAKELIPKRTHLGFTAIPTAAIRANGVDYVHYFDAAVFGNDNNPDNFSGLFKSTDDGQNWTRCPNVVFAYDSPFFMAAYEKKDGYVYMIGSRKNRLGLPHLARIPEDGMEDKANYRFWDGSTWNVNESAAIPIFDMGSGEASLMWHEKHKMWIYTYVYGDVGLHYAQAANITGPWKISLSPLIPGIGWGGYGCYMHKLVRNSDWIYFMTSTWQHYNVFVIRMTVGPVQ